ncbi:hypothetical protein BLA39750_00967 [Burkholderia lata]|uniref:Uncharacterized protein n=1 Tax=Burkholderia lata (strain ATCC 17760 / DSM 23089 / LMG 22485 / NCIMB 9086 / R18194 / 383) TaxID=482957 RepID=A0A6P2UQM1_BURL3|nr:hypothetical protein BLA39750_00967 [Burkholderia lata]
MPHYYVYGERREIPESPVFAAYLRRTDVAIVSIDMHEGHLSEASDCPCPSPRGRDIVPNVDRFHDEARELGIPQLFT